MARKVLISDPLPDLAREIVERGGELEAVVMTEGYDSVLPEIEGWIVRSGTTVTADLIAQAPKLRCVARAGAGVDNVDVKAATARDIVVMNTPGGNARAAAELAIGLAFSVARSIPQAHLSMANGAWDRKTFKGFELGGKTLGIVGMGRVGREVASMGKGLGMTCLGYDPHFGEKDGQEIGVESVALDDLFAQSDFISLHVPRNEATAGMVNAERLAKCKPSAYLINCARGGVVDEGAVLAAVDSGQIAGAAFDVFADEPLGEDSPFRSHPKIIATPHIGASTAEAQIVVARMAAEQVRDYLVDGKAVHVVSG